MAKRTLLLFALASLCAGAAFSLDAPKRVKKSAPKDFSLSAGGRVFYNGLFDEPEYTYTYTPIGDDDPYYYDPRRYAASFLDNSIFDNHGFGIGGFFDACYVEIGLDFIFGTFTSVNGDSEINSTQFGFSLMGKFPFALGQMTVFPLLGIDYQTFLSGEADGYTLERDDLSVDYEDLYDAFSIAVGGGVDFRISAKLYLRGELLVNFKMESDAHKALKRLAKDNDISFSIFTLGPRISVGVGYKL